MRLAILLSAVVLVASAGTPVAQTLDELLDRHAAARGGRAAIESVESLLIEVRIVEPGFSVEARYCAARDGSMRVDIYGDDGARLYTEALEAGRAWSRAAGDEAPVAPVGTAGTAALRHGVESPLELFGLHEMRERGHRLRLRGRELVDGVDYFVVRAVLDDGHESFYYLDPFRQVERRLDTREVLATNTVQRVVVNP